MPSKLLFYTVLSDLGPPEILLRGSSMTHTRTAFLSVHTDAKDKKFVEFARTLAEWEWNLLASSGTAKFLVGHGLVVDDLAHTVGEPILDHRVVSLSRRFYAMLLADRNRPEDMAELGRLGLVPIDLVYAAFYPLSEKLAEVRAANLDADEAYRRVLESVDIGGPCMLRAAAKGGRIVVSNPDQFDVILGALHEGKATSQFLAGLAAAAERCASIYATYAEDFYAAVAAGTFPQQGGRESRLDRLPPLGRPYSSGGDVAAEPLGRTSGR